MRALCAQPQEPLTAAGAVVPLPPLRGSVTITVTLDGLNAVLSGVFVN